MKYYLEKSYSLVSPNCISPFYWTNKMMMNPDGARPTTMLYLLIFDLLISDVILVTKNLYTECGFQPRVKSTARKTYSPWFQSAGEWAAGRSALDIRGPAQHREQTAEAPSTVGRAASASADLPHTGRDVIMDISGESRYDIAKLHIYHAHTLNTACCLVVCCFMV